MDTYYLKDGALLFRIMKNVVAAAFILTLVNGCGIFSTLTKTTRKIAQNANQTGEHMRKKVAVATFGYGALQADDSLEKFLQASIADRIRRKCPKVDLITPADAAYADLLVSVPRHASGRINNFRLAEEARRHGLNATIAGAPLSVHEEVEEKGLLWFRSSHAYGRLAAAVDVYDTATGAKLIGNHYSRNIEVDAEGLAKIKQKEFRKIDGLRELLPGIADEAAENICDAVRVQPWSGYILSVNGKSVTLSSGSRAGLVVGDTLTVYAKQETTAGIDGQQFYLPGQKIGEIRIASVKPDEAEARIVSGKGISKDDMVLFK